MAQIHSHEQLFGQGKYSGLAQGIQDLMHGKVAKIHEKQT